MRPAPAALSLPTIPRDIPSLFTVDAPTDFLHVVAEGLLAEGMLRESDWNAEVGLTGSVCLGLRRWTLDTLPAHFENDIPWTNLPSFEIGISDHCGKWQVDVAEDIGGFALLQNDQENLSTFCTVGPQVQALENWQAQVGESVLAMLYKGLYSTLSASTPRWALGVVQHWWDCRDIGEEYDEDLKPRFYRTLFPRMALRPRWRPMAMREARQESDWMQNAGEKDWRGKAVLLAWELHKTLAKWERERKAGRCRGDDARYYDTDYVTPVVIEWESEGPVARIYDDMNEMAYQIGISPCGWLAQFPSGTVEGVRVAARSLRYALQVITLCDRLLSLLDTPVERVQVPVEID